MALTLFTPNMHTHTFVHHLERDLQLDSFNSRRILNTIARSSNKREQWTIGGWNLSSVDDNPFQLESDILDSPQSRRYSRVTTESLAEELNGKQED